MGSEPTSVRVALLLGLRGAAPWVCSLASALDGADGVALLGRCHSPDAAPPLSLVERLHARLEQRVFGVPHPLATRRTRGAIIDRLPWLEDLRGVDVLLATEGRPPREVISRFHGEVWGFTTDADGRTPGPVAFAPSSPGIRTSLMAFGETPAGDRVLDSMITTAHQRSVHRGIEEAVAWWPAVMVRRLAARRLGLELPQPEVQHPQRRSTGIGAVDVLLSSLGTSVDFALGRLRGRFRRDQWQLGFQIGGRALRPDRLVRMTPPPDRFWADPFPVRRGDGWVIFCEEQVFGTPHGYIAALSVDADGRWGRIGAVLKRPHHLSYPFILEWSGELYMIPEAGISGRLVAYRCVRFPDQWEEAVVLLEGQAVFDATVFEHDGDWWMLSTGWGENAAASSLSVHFADSPLGPWQAHPLNPVKLDCRSARCGGRVRRVGGMLVRPAQDCSERYGGAINMQRISALDRETFSEHTVERVDPGWEPDVIAVHTLNFCDGLIAVDLVSSLPRGTLGGYRRVAVPRRGRDIRCDKGP